MRALIIFFVAAILVQSCSTIKDSKDYDLVIQNVKLFDGYSVSDNTTLLIQDGSVFKIIIGKTNLQGQNVIDGEGKTIIPGLINAHTHAYEENELKEAAKTGVLTVISLGHKFPKKADNLRFLSTTSSSIAYFYSAGNTLTVPNGHGTQFGKVPVVSNADSIPAFVKARVEEGSEFIKLIVDSGSKKRPLPTLSQEMVKSAIITARQFDKLSIVHIWNRADAIMAAKAGANGLAHIWATDTTDISENELSIFSESNLFIIPTLVVLEPWIERMDNQEQLTRDIYRLYKAKVPIITGTDAARGRAVNFGTSIHDELKLFVQCGMTPLDALKSATSIPSKYLNLGERGQIREGFSADFVLIDGDPTENINDISKIEAIWKRGNRIIPYNKK